MKGKVNVLMDLKDIQLISSLQSKLAKWLSYNNSVTYSKLYDACLELLHQESFGMNQELPRSLFYSIVFPLVKVGIIEYGVSGIKNTKFFLPLENDGQSFIKRDANNFSRYSLPCTNKAQLRKAGKNILRSLPSIQTYIEALEVEPITNEFGYVYDEFIRSLKRMNDPFKGDLGIYKVKDLVYFPYYLVDVKGKIHKIPSYRTCFECMDYAHSYILSASGRRGFEYSESEKSVRFFRQSHVPPFVMRAMCMIYPDVFDKDDIYVGNTVKFYEVDKSILKELTRIFQVKK